MTTSSSPRSTSSAPSPTGQLVARATADVEPIKLLLTGGVSVFAQLAGTIGFAVVVMLLIDPELAGIALIPLPVAIAVQLLYGARTRATTVRAEERRGIVATEANDDVRAARLIFALGLEGRERAQFARAVAALFRGYLGIGRLDAAYGSVLDFIPYVSLGLVLAFGSRAVVDGRISLGEFVTFFGFASILSVASNQVGYFTYLVASAAGSATRILELLHHPREPMDADDGDTGGWRGLTWRGSRSRSRAPRPRSRTSTSTSRRGRRSRSSARPAPGSRPCSTSSTG